MAAVPSRTAAARIVNDVRRRGDAALRDWRRRLGDAPGPIEVTARELERGWDSTPADVRKAIRFAARNIRIVAERQRPRPFAVSPVRGVRIEQRVVAFNRVGCYVPAGRYPLPSSLLMTAVTARAAGVTEVIAVCPKPSAVVYAAALEAGVDRLFRVGGAQAIAAMAYGTRTIPRVDKIAGPGNAWVTAAKSLVSADCAIDMHAGPSEIAIYSNTGDPEWIAADLLAQAEHDPLARAIFVTTRPALAKAVRARVDRSFSVGRSSNVGRSSGVGRSFSSGINRTINVVPSRAAALALMNAIAPEHAVCDNAADARALTTAGTVFVGRWSAQASGDYATGSNHVLPTNGAARWRGGLSAADFVRVFTVQTLTRSGVRAIGPAAMALARAEGLVAHEASIALRVPR
ncbi:MAG: histidinol dehydrogenase [Acidobacteria bacterium]|nr:MAG: histidinol dehydrogenase [Acidobacteriota bacterium]